MVIFLIHHMGPSEYLSSLGGLIPGNLIRISQECKCTLCDDIRSIFMNQIFKQLAEYIKQGIHPPNVELVDTPYDMEHFVSNLLDDLYVTILETKTPGGKVAATVNMYLDLEAPDPSYRQTILDALPAVNFQTNHFGTGHYRNGWQCHKCQGIDHPHRMCPYDSIPGWTEITRPLPTTQPVNMQEYTPQSPKYQSGHHASSLAQGQYQNPTLNRNRQNWDFRGRGLGRGNARGSFAGERGGRPTLNWN